MRAGTFLAILGIAFIALKLAGFIAWPWELVLLPLWGPYVLAFLLVLLQAILELAQQWAGRKRSKH